MRFIRSLALVSLLVLPPATTVFAADTSSYQCDNGVTIQLAFPDASHAIMNYQGELILLKSAETASGARYVGGDWQLWGKGSSSFNLAHMKDNESFASDKGNNCTRIKSNSSKRNK
ncbi:MAG: MliC family protein [Enterobacteriaceae bacterium]